METATFIIMLVLLLFMILLVVAAVNCVMLLKALIEGNKAQNQRLDELTVGSNAVNASSIKLCEGIDNLARSIGIIAKKTHNHVDAGDLS